MTNPITPPPELVRHWSRFQGDTDPEALWFRIANEAAQWGADQELEACCDHMRDLQWGFAERPDGTKIHRAVYLQQSRRPKPPSLKEQAIRELGGAYDRDKIDDTTYDTIRRALEALPDD
jgi:hypothetical protein